MVHHLSEPMTFGSKTSKISLDENTARISNKFATALALEESTDYQKKLVKKLKKLFGN